MRIGAIIARIGGMDGVALEFEKWLAVLRQLGHEVYIATGEVHPSFALGPQDRIIPEASFFSRECILEQDLAFYNRESDETHTRSVLGEHTVTLQKKLRDFITHHQIEYLILENISSLPSHLSLGLAVKELIGTLSIPCLAHDHDFAAERPQRYHSHHPSINALIETAFPLSHPNVLHAVINETAKRSLQTHHNIQAIKIPNVINFKTFAPQHAQETANVKTYLKCQPNDILLFQVTRIVRRKCIETAIELIHKLNHPHIKLVIAGNAEDDHNQTYLNELKALVTTQKLSAQVIFAPNIFSHNTFRDHYLPHYMHSAPHIAKPHAPARPPTPTTTTPTSTTPTSTTRTSTFSLQAAYHTAAACTYFSSYEGFGNGYLEAIAAKRLIFVNNYKPVFQEEIATLGFKHVVTENNELTPAVIRAIEERLADPLLREAEIAHNHALGREHFSLEVLENHLKTTLALA